MESPITVNVQTEPQAAVNVQLIDRVPSWARAFGVLALVCAILALIVPVIGPLFIAIPAALLTMIALYGGDRKLGMISFSILAINTVISPSIWLSLFGNAMSAKGPTDAIWLPIIVIILVLGIIPFLFKKRV